MEKMAVSIIQTAVKISHSVGKESIFHVSQESLLVGILEVS